MGQIEVNAKTAASLETPFEIRYSLFVLCVYTLVIGFIAFPLIYGVVIVASDPEAQHRVFDQTGPAPWIALGLAIVASALLYFRVLRPWWNFRRAVITLSKDGITLRGKPTIPWRDLESNRFFTLPSGVLTISFLRLRTRGGQKIGLFATDLRIDEEDYFRLCDLYRAAAEKALTVRAA